MSAYITEKAVEIGARWAAVKSSVRRERAPTRSRKYQTTHNTGGTVMGDDPTTSVVEPLSAELGRHRTCSFIGASNFPQNASYNPTGTLGALCYWTADAIVNRYLKAPGPNGDHMRAMPWQFAAGAVGASLTSLALGQMPQIGATASAGQQSWEHNSRHMAGRASQHVRGVMGRTARASTRPASRASPASRPRIC